MFRATAALLLSATLAACGSAPRDAGVVPGQAEVARPHGGCAQSDWQAQTAPVINKRQGNEALEKYEAESQEQGAGCR